jgi:hypothetical protein
MESIADRGNRAGMRLHEAIADNTDVRPDGDRVKFRHYTRERWRRIYGLVRMDVRDGRITRADVHMLKMPYRLAAQCLIDREGEWR